MTRHWRKDFPYYKIQLFNRDVNSWKDEPRAYGTLNAVRRVIRKKFKDHKVRIMVVEQKGRHVLEG